MLSIRRPDWNTDRFDRVTLKSDLLSIATGQIHDPKIGVTAAVREIDHFSVPWTDGRCLHLSGLTCDLNSAAYILCGRAVDWIFPNVELNVLFTGEQNPVGADLWLNIRDIAKGQLPRLATNQIRRPQIEVG